MKLKIKIKEVKEERRPLTIEEQCVFSVSNNCYSGDLVKAAKQHLKDINLSSVEKSPNTLTSLGIFRTETIRDATDNEIRAWHFLRIVEKCGDSCVGCIKNGNHVSCTAFSDEIQANGLLLNKEVILELVDE